MRRHAAQEPDRRLAVAREDPVLVVERGHGADLHGLVVPEYGVGADPALAVVDDRALVVGAHEDELPVELERGRRRRGRRPRRREACRRRRSHGGGRARPEAPGPRARVYGPATAPRTTGPSSPSSFDSQPSWSWTARVFSPCGASYQRTIFGCGAARASALELRPRDDLVVQSVLDEEVRVRHADPDTRVEARAEGPSPAALQVERLDAGLSARQERPLDRAEAQAGEPDALLRTSRRDRRRSTLRRRSITCWTIAARWRASEAKFSCGFRSNGSSGTSSIAPAGGEPGGLEEQVVPRHARAVRPDDGGKRPLARGNDEVRVYAAAVHAREGDVVDLDRVVPVDDALVDVVETLVGVVCEVVRTAPPCRLRSHR